MFSQWPLLTSWSHCFPPWGWGFWCRQWFKMILTQTVLWLFCFNYLNSIYTGVPFFLSTGTCLVLQQCVTSIPLRLHCGPMANLYCPLSWWIFEGFQSSSLMLALCQKYLIHTVRFQRYEPIRNEWPFPHLLYCNQDFYWTPMKYQSCSLTYSWWIFSLRKLFSWIQHILWAIPLMELNQLVFGCGQDYILHELMNSNLVDIVFI